MRCSEEHVDLNFTLVPTPINFNSRHFNVDGRNLVIPLSHLHFPAYALRGYLRDGLGQDNLTRGYIIILYEPYELSQRQTETLAEE